MSHLPLDARAILDYLNELGYRNISAEQLKEFMKDLRKLIKYEETLGINAHQDNYFERLFKRTTASFRAKVDKDKENTHCERAVDVKSKRDHDAHTLRSLNKKEHQQQLESRAAMAKKGNQFHSTRTNSTSQYGTTFGGSSMGDKLNAKQKYTQQQKQVQSAEPRKKVSEARARPHTTTIGAGTLSREQAWQSNKRVPFSECNELRGPQSEDTEQTSTRPSAKREPSLKRGHTATNTIGIKEDKNKSNGAASNPRVESRDTNRGRTRVRYPSHERSASRRSPSGGSYTTARSLGVMIPRQCTATRRRRPLSKDPVALYHYYQSEWNYFREQIPGESSHSELRWMIRERLLDPN
uniref:Centriolar and ciliogenesis-associated protein HYLS1 C-terminal domain-containing protein n=2 Tax=Bactrocera latifrons TaxID=174628 RepID=A0A0K8V561_BACLA